MMLTGVMGACAVAPRLNRLKKPRPMKSLSVQGDTSPNQGDGIDDFTTTRDMSMRSIDSNESTGSCCQESPACKDGAVFGRFFGDQDEHREKCQPRSRQDSSSSLSNSELQQVYRRQDSSSSLSNSELQQVYRRQDSSSSLSNSELQQVYRRQDSSSSLSNSGLQQVYRRQDSCSSLGSAAFSTPSNRNRLLSTSNDSAISQETPCLYTRTSSVTDNVNNNCMDESLHRAGTACSCQSNPSLKDDDCKHVCADALESGRCRYHRAAKHLTTATQMDNMDLDKSRSFKGQSKGSTRAVLVTGQDDELILIGKNLQAVLQASRILLKELDAKLVKIETVTDDSSCEVISRDGSQVCAGTNVKSKLDTPASGQSVIATKCQQNALDQRGHYSKQQLLRLSRSLLSRQPPPMWCTIASLHTDCCLPASKVREYFVPSAFHYHDGTFVKANML